LRATEFGLCAGFESRETKTEQEADLEINTGHVTNMAEAQVRRIKGITVRAVRVA
jgi:hypothetical protein